MIGVIFYIGDLETEVLLKDSPHFPTLLKSQLLIVSCVGSKIPRAEDEVCARQHRTQFTVDMWTEMCSWPQVTDIPDTGHKMD